MIISKGRALRLLKSEIPEDLTIKVSEKIELPCLQLLRVLPGRRLVMVSTWQGRQVIAKVFFSKWSRKNHADREWQNTQLLQQSGILTPACFARFKVSGMQILIFEHLNNMTCVAKIDALLIEAVASLHRQGFYQSDMHCNNFLRYKDDIYVIDVGSLVYRRCLSRREQFNNLAMLVAQFPNLSPQEREHIYVTYCENRQYKTSYFSDFERRIVNQKQARARRYFRKLLRATSAHSCQRKKGKLILCEREYWPVFELFLQDPEQVLLQGEVIKAGRSSTVYKVLWDNEWYVVKRYNIKTLWHFIRRFCRASRAIHSWQFSHLLRHFLISTPEPIAMCEFNRYGWKRKSYFIMKYSEKNQLAEYVKAHPNDHEEIVDQVKRLFYQLILSRISHGDLKQSNILMDEQGPMLIDLDGMRWYRSSFAARQVWKSQWRRFLRNWSDFPSLQALFLKCTKN